MKKILLRILHFFNNEHAYEVCGFHNLNGGKDQILKCDCGKELYSKEEFVGYNRGGKR